jgi:DNA polymerase-3 subunit delta
LTPIIELDTPSVDEMREWVEKRCRHEGKTIAPDALELLMAGAAASLTLLTQEVEKLLLLAKDQPQITLNDVIQISSRSKLKTIFDLWESIAVRKKDLAFYILRELQQERISIQELIGLFRWQLSRLFQGEELVQAGRASKKEIASALKIPFFVADKFLTQLRQFPRKRIAQAYHSILKADEELKVGSRQEKEIIDFLLYRLMV